MGSEQVCTVRFDGATFRPSVLLEHDRIICRGALRLTIPFANITAIDAREGIVTVRWGDRSGAQSVRGGDPAERVAEIEVGSSAARWVKAVREPRTILDKLGIAQAQRVSLVGFGHDGPAVPGEPPMIEWLAARGVDASTRLRTNSDMILFAARRARDLDKLPRLRTFLKPNGAIWVIRAKGSSIITERQVMSAGKAAGLVDVKVASFSPTHTAEKLVIPVKDRVPGARIAAGTLNR